MSSMLSVAEMGDVGSESLVIEATLTNSLRRNALSPALLDELISVIEQAGATGARAMILRAERGVSTWSAGFEIDALPLDGTDPLTWTNPLEELLHRVREAPFPIIAAVEGGVWGGACELVLTCDLIVALESATMAITPVRLGVPYNTAGVMRLLSALPLNIAREMFFTGDPLGADEWARYGVVNRLVADSNELEAVSRQLGRRIASRAPLAVRAIKGEITALTDARSLSSDDFERLTELRRAAWMSEDYREGVRSFLEKRPARFNGR